MIESCQKCLDLEADIGHWKRKFNAATMEIKELKKLLAAEKAKNRRSGSAAPSILSSKQTSLF